MFCLVISDSTRLYRLRTEKFQEDQSITGVYFSFLSQYFRQIILNGHFYGGKTVTGSLITSIVLLEVEFLRNCHFFGKIKGLKFYYNFSKLQWIKTFN